MPAPRRVVVAAFPGVDLLDVTGPAEVFSVASDMMGGGPPRVPGADRGGPGR
ncbi:hypothetical protein [Streptomyces sudanensis]|uniref:hypothetical protein n=1 Tax=Streptomyces sudanensis TaxID=436397 RepID=UPI0020CF2094|nr:hypothetical protein [Streptomyces sudanensis]